MVVMANHGIFSLRVIIKPQHAGPSEAKRMDAEKIKSASVFDFFQIVRPDTVGNVPTQTFPDRQIMDVKLAKTLRIRFTFRKNYLKSDAQTRQTF